MKQKSGKVIGVAVDKITGAIKTVMKARKMKDAVRPRFNKVKVGK